MSASVLWLIVLNSLCLVTGQMLWKSGMQDRTIVGIPDMLRAVTAPVILAGLGLYGVATFLWLYILNKVELSYAYPIQSLAYVIAVVAACVLFKEAVTVNRWIGVVVICLGVYLVSMK